MGQSASAMAMASSASRTFGYLMLLNYLTHGLNILNDPTIPPPEDGLTAILRNGLRVSDESVYDRIHGTTHVAAGAYGLMQLVLQAQSMFGAPAPAAAASTSIASASTSSSAI